MWTCSRMVVGERVVVGRRGVAQRGRGALRRWAGWWFLLSSVWLWPAVGAGDGAASRTGRGALASAGIGVTASDGEGGDEFGTPICI